MINNDEVFDTNLTYCNVGARKYGNNCDDIIIINAIMNYVVNRTKNTIYLELYDIGTSYDAYCGSKRP